MAAEDICYSLASMGEGVSSNAQRRAELIKLHHLINGA